MKEIEIIDYFPAYDVSLAWYKDPLTVKMVDGVQKAYELDDLIRMYSYLSKHGDLFYIEYDDKLIGDCAIFDDSMVALVLDKDYRGKGLGSLVLKSLIDYAKDKGLRYLKAEIYDFNEPSLNLFSKFGFKEYGNELYRLDF
ncbi:GNAT family N-acetyltransferase [Anaerococcus sp. Marseille-P3915]|uniref:GNAT family N-acetyltransferase n=1 Tax=Anaerococcus sp. Marseille-P3915 TaxID=2057799 RepID=UPI000D0AC596|nr:GNAT family N-acetyltransferase [Anaerococcus sp. Marseille-P3915]